VVIVSYSITTCLRYSCALWSVNPTIPYSKRLLASSASKGAQFSRNTKVRYRQNSETNPMHFLFNLLRIMDLYMIRALLSHPQELLHKRNLLYCVRVISVGCIRIKVDFNSRNIPSEACAGPPKDEQVMLETYRGP
jgi:hypothetical protein